ncbi:MAG: CPBP family intramembrane metalloprotease [Peptococcaceae bacterium]|jgi:membrane protease YdiL (CAAX protease family)|nr:CPBP family intramembrane metalloprotease [Peptococcaceae bacterium]
MNIFNLPVKAKTALSAAGILAVYLLIPSLFLMLALTVTLPAGDGAGSSVAESLFTVTGCLAAVLLIAGRFRKKGLSLAQATRLAPLEMSKAAVARILAAGVGCGVALSALLSLLPLPARWLESYDALALSAFEGEGRILAVLIITFITPLSEELIFRGFMLRILLGGFAPRWAVLITAAAFGLCHMHPLWISYAFLCGLLLGCLAAGLDNLTASLAFHIGVNLSSLPAIFWRDAPWLARFGASWPLLLLALAVGGGGSAFLLIRELKVDLREKWAVISDYLARRGKGALRKT